MQGDWWVLVLGIIMLSCGIFRKIMKKKYQNKK